MIVSFRCLICDGEGNYSEDLQTPKVEFLVRFPRRFHEEVPFRRQPSHCSAKRAEADASMSELCPQVRHGFKPAPVAR